MDGLCKSIIPSLTVVASLLRFLLLKLHINNNYVELVNFMEYKSDSMHLYIWSYYNCTMVALSKLLFTIPSSMCRKVDSKGRELGGPVEGLRDYVGAQAVISDRGKMYFHRV